MQEVQRDQTAPGAVPDRMVDIGAVLMCRGLSATSVIYREIGEGLFIEPIKLSARCSRWLETEVSAIDSARIAGMSDTEIRKLVNQLRARRKARGEQLMVPA